MSCEIDALERDDSLQTMTMPTPLVDRLNIDKSACPAPSQQSQRGVVLIVALVLLVVISLLAVTSVRNAGSSESVSSNVRTTELSTQAADIALRYCEAKAYEMRAADTTPVGTLNQWKSLENWDGNWSNKDNLFKNSAFVLDESLVNQSVVTYRRPPECMIEEQIPDVNDPPLTSKFYTITARGFGPEVPALIGGNRIRPVGSEVWLQSTLEIEKK